MPPKTLLPSLAFLASFASPATAAVITLIPGVERTDDPVTGVNDWTLDAGLVIGSLPASPNRIIFEAGGDGLGSALALVGSELLYYYDIGDFQNSSPAGDAFFSLDISSLAGSVISLRLDADLSTASDTVSLTATNGSLTLNNSVAIPTDRTSIAGGNNTGFGLTAADLAGLDESAEPGFPNMAQFNTTAYKSTVANGPGANILGADQLAGTLYTTLADQPPGSIPTPSSWGLVIPEPGTGLLVAFATAALAFRRRR
ncbi:MAG: PEP-CTERM sorting domain-containing protein [Verrucomicrobiales bacterium]|nr:PEP-CTERM sorting domain-containing protein [Verrucomicrobiales bacterium]